MQTSDFSTLNYNVVEVDVTQGSNVASSMGQTFMSLIKNSKHPGFERRSTSLLSVVAVRCLGLHQYSI